MVGGWDGPGSQSEQQFYINNVLFVCWLLDKRHGRSTHNLQHSQNSLNTQILLLHTWLSFELYKGTDVFKCDFWRIWTTFLSVSDKY